MVSADDLSGVAVDTDSDLENGEHSGDICAA